jgi:hypothetical protein
MVQIGDGNRIVRAGIKAACRFGMPNRQAAHYWQLD